MFNDNTPLNKNNVNRRLVKNGCSIHNTTSEVFQHLQLLILNILQGCWQIVVMVQVAVALAGEHLVQIGRFCNGLQSVPQLVYSSGFWGSREFRAALI